METVYQAFSAAVERFTDNAFLCVPALTGRDYLPDGTEQSYGAAAEAVERLRHRYASAGYGCGHRVALLLGNRPEFLAHYLALNAVGASIVPVNPDYQHSEMLFQLEHSEAELAICSTDRIADMVAVTRACANPVHVLDVDALPTSFPEPATALTDVLANEGSECALLYTSGTTGRPKGCILTNEYFMTAGRWYLDLGGLMTFGEGQERVLNPLPLFHMNALAITVTGTILSGNCLITPDRFHPKTWWQDVAATRATAIHYLGVVPAILLNQPRDKIERTHCVRFGVGAGVDPRHHEEFERRFGFPLLEVWGMTETGRIFCDCVEPRHVGTRAFGRPRNGLQVRIVDPTGRDVAPDQEGELIVRFTGPDPRKGFFAGYLKNEKETELAWRGGWFHTGDVVIQDADGMLRFVDRMKNIVRRSGENISAAEVEAVLQEHESIAQAAVVAVLDEIREEEVLACVVPLPGVEVTEAFAHELIDWCLTRLAYFKAPGYLIFCESLPTTGTQKVQKSQIFEIGTDPRRAPGCLDLRERKRNKRR